MSLPSAVRVPFGFRLYAALLVTVTALFLSACAVEEEPNTVPDPVANPVLVSIAVTPATIEIETSATQQFLATGTYDDASTVNLTGTATWTSSDAMVAFMNASGVAYGVAVGSAVITATSGAIQGIAAITVVLPPPVLQPDLSITLDSITTISASSAHIYYTVTNNGTASYAGGDVEFEFFDNPGVSPTVGVTTPTHATTVTLPSLAIGESSAGDYAANFTAPENTGEAYLAVDTLDAVSEDSEINNVSAPLAWVLPDLLVTLNSITIINDTLNRASITITNNGAAPVSGDIQVEYYENQLAPPTPGDLSDSWNTVTPAGGIAGFGGSDIFSVSFSSDQFAFGGKAYVTVNPAFSIRESNEGNNVSNMEFWGTQDRPDLTVSINSVTGGGPASVNYTIVNQGNVDFNAGSFSMSLIPDDAGVPAVGDFAGHLSISPGAIPVGGAVTRTDTFGFAGAGGTAYMMVDSVYNVPEVDDSNNISAGFIWGGGGPPQPDLTVAITGVADQGDGTADVSYTVSNGGAGDTDGSSFALGFFEDEFAAPNLGDAADATVAILPGTILGGGAFSGTVNFPTTCLFGRAFLAADKNYQISESDETNNVSTSFSWGPPAARPDLSVSVNNIVDNFDGTATVSFTISNNGAGDADGCHMSLDFFSAPGAAPSFGDAGVFLNVASGIIPAGGTYSGSFTSAATPGTSYVIVNNFESIPEEDTTNNISNGVAW